MRKNAFAGRIFSVCVLMATLGGCVTVPNQDFAKQEIEVYRRTSERRTAIFLTTEEARGYALLALPFARVASYVYCEHLVRKVKLEKAAAEECEKLHPLGDFGWKGLFDSSEVLNDHEVRTGIAFSAFARPRPDGGADVVIAFRGTDFTKLNDWKSNLRWITRFLPGEDQYNVLHRRSKEIIDRALNGAKKLLPETRSFAIYTTGHSLGGGLAQSLAYTDRRVEGAVVFNPSPVTGYSTVVRDDEVNCNVRLLRVYERGEALQYVRSFIRQFYTLSDNIHEVAFDLLHSHGNPFRNHSMQAFRDALQEVAKVGEGTLVPIAKLPGTPDCDCYGARRAEARTEWPQACLVPHRSGNANAAEANIIKAQ